MNQSQMQAKQKKSDSKSTYEGVFKRFMSYTNIMQKIMSLCVDSSVDFPEQK